MDRRGEISSKVEYMQAHAAGSEEILPVNVLQPQSMREVYTFVLHMGQKKHTAFPPEEHASVLSPPQRSYRRWGTVRSRTFGRPQTTNATRRSWPSSWRAAGPRTPQRGPTSATSRSTWPNSTSETRTLLLFIACLIRRFLKELDHSNYGKQL